MGQGGPPWNALTQDGLVLVAAIRKLRQEDLSPAQEAPAGEAPPRIAEGGAS
ncbi:hypothetical protein ACN47A_36295 [Myxococcus fulvus]|uniref:hypothetical protein n=1 Tax=Myxococcus fulvus TaxID=33 RepID=UPI003B9A10A8